MIILLIQNHYIGMDGNTGNKNKQGAPPMLKRLETGRFGETPK
jgi:hypothetical protein